MSRYVKEESIGWKKDRTGKRNVFNSEGSRQVLSEISNLCGIQSRQCYPKRTESKHRESSSQGYSQIEIKTVLSKNRFRVKQEITCVVRKSVRNAVNKGDSRNTVDNLLEATSRGDELVNKVDEKLCSKLNQCSLNNVEPRDKIKWKNNEDESDIEEPFKKYEGNLFLCTAYVKDIYRHLLSLEDQFEIKINFLRGMQITPSVRALVVDWMMDVQLLFKMSNESFHLSVYLIDCYLATRRNTKKDDLPLVAVACLLVAGKYDMVHPPHLEDLLRAMENSLRKRDVLKMEVEVLKTVRMKLNKPAIACFLRKYGIVADIDKTHHCCSKFFVDACLLNYSICHYKSSLIAAAATFISLCLKYETVNSCLWNNNLSVHSKYEFQDFLPLIRFLAPFVIELPDKKYSRAIMEKYSTNQCLNVKETIYSRNNKEIMKSICSNFRHNNHHCSITTNKYSKV